MSHIIECNQLTKYYHGQPALNHVNLTVESGKIVGLLGPNGSGKTTLLKILSGLLTPNSGTATICGISPGTRTKSFVSFLPERTYFRSNQKVSELVQLFSDFYEDFNQDTASKMLADLDIDPSRKLSTLSKGTKEKVQLILVMSRNAKLFLLDEPIAGVDPAARDYIIRTIISNYNPDASVVISTHLISDVENTLDEAVFIRFGEIMLHKTIDEIREEAGKSLDEYFREVFAC